MNGIPCPVCGSIGYKLLSCRHEGKDFFRRKKCSRCGAVFHTMEMVVNLPKKSRYNLEPLDMRRVRLLRSAGMTYKQIGAEMGCSHVKIWKALNATP